MLVTETNMYIKHCDWGGVWSGINLLETLIRCKFCCFCRVLLPQKTWTKTSSLFSARLVLLYMNVTRVKYLDWKEVRLVIKVEVEESSQRELVFSAWHKRVYDFVLFCGLLVDLDCNSLFGAILVSCYFLKTLWETWGQFCDFWQTFFFFLSGKTYAPLQVWIRKSIFQKVFFLHLISAFA